MDIGQNLKDIPHLYHNKPCRKSREQRAPHDSFTRAWSVPLEVLRLFLQLLATRQC